MVLLKPRTVDEAGLPDGRSLCIALYQTATNLMRQGKVCAAYTPTYGGVAEAVMKMGFGNGIGFTFAE